MQRKFLTNITLLLFLNFLVKPFWIFGIDRTIQNIVGAGEYGWYSSLLNFTFLFNILLDFWIKQLFWLITTSQELLHRLGCKACLQCESWSCPRKDAKQRQLLL